MKRYLIFKLLMINLVVLGFAMAIVWGAIDTLAAGYFVTLMEKYNISPKPAHSMFVGAIHRYMIWASVSAVLLAAALSFVMTRRVLSPLVKMNAISKEIGAGNYDVQVPVNSSDEVGQLAGAFNRMAGNLQKVEMLRKTLMIDVAHELRTPLTNIRGYLEAIHDGVLPPSVENIALLQAESGRLSRLVEDVLDLARADAAPGRLVFEKEDLAAFVKSVTQSVVFAPGVRPARGVRFDGDAHPIRVMMDKRRLARVVRNLADNALSYSPPASEVIVVLSALPEAARVTFFNETNELSVDDLPFLFERFYRGEKSRSREHGGAGIGLAIVKEIVTAHGGTVGAAYENGRASIWFELPSVSAADT